MIESTRKDIEKVSFELLKNSKSLDIFPTPIDKIIQHSELIIDKKIDLSNIDKNFFDFIKEKVSGGFRILQQGLSNIKGAYDRNEKTIYLSEIKNQGRKNFVKLHETGHGVLPWQNEVIAAFDNSQTLNPDFEEEFEQEANYFASITLFQHDRFVREMKKVDFGLPGASALAQKFGSSVHASFRNYIFKTNKRCLLLVLDPIQNKKLNRPICSKRNLFYSKSFLKEFSEVHLPEVFGITWNFIKIYLNPKIRFFTNGEIKLITNHGEVISCEYHLFKNGYNTFVFIFPVGEKYKASNKIILKN
jgi:hypothetical protein